MKFLTELIQPQALYELLDTRPLCYVMLSLLLFTVAKKAFDFATPYDLNHQLTSVDNKAIAISFTGHIIGIGLIIWGVLTLPGSPELGRDLMAMTAWSLLGIVLLILSGLMNNRFVLSHFDINKELVEDKNIGAGVVSAGAFISSALIIRSSLLAHEKSFMASFGMVLLYFVIGQILMILYVRIFQAITRYDIHGEIEKGNTAAGVSLGLNLIAIGVLISSYLEENESLAGLGAWFLIGTALLILSRYIVDKAILPGVLLDEEIKLDQNWGAALIEGGIAIMLSFILIATF